VHDLRLRAVRVRTADVLGSLTCLDSVLMEGRALTADSVYKITADVFMPVDHKRVIVHNVIKSVRMAVHISHEASLLHRVRVHAVILLRRTSSSGSRSGI
jgi:hypothetical protein